MSKIRVEDRGEFTVIHFRSQMVNVPKIDMMKCLTNALDGYINNHLMPTSIRDLVRFTPRGDEITITIVWPAPHAHKNESIIISNDYAKMVIEQCQK
jgi:hypothetical protein